MSILYIENYSKSIFFKNQYLNVSKCWADVKVKESGAPKIRWIGQSAGCMFYRLQIFNGQHQ